VTDSSSSGPGSPGGACEDLLRVSPSLYAQVFEAVTAGIAVKDPRGVYRWVNAAFAALLDRIPEEIAGRTDADLFAREDLADLAEADRLALSGRSVSGRPLAVPGSDPAVWVRVDRKPLPGEGGQPAGIVLTLRDATAEYRLSASESEKRMILDSFEDVGLHFVDRELSPVWSNPAGSRLWTAMELCGDACGVPDAPACPRCAARLTLETGAEREDEIPFPRDSGEGRHLLVRTLPVREPGGPIRGALQVALDITHRKRAEALRCESEHLFHGLFLDNPAASWFVCPDTGDILEANPAACRFYGYDAQTLRRMKVWDINLLPKEVVLEKMAEVKRSACMFDPFPHRLAGGAYRDVLIFSSPVRFRNRDCLYSIIVDITERRRAEMALRESRANMAAVLQSTHDLFASRDRSHRLMVYNAAFAKICPRLYGVEAAPGLATADFLPPDRSRRWKEKLDRVLAGESIEVEISRLFLDGETRVHEVRLSPVRSGDQIIGTAEFSRDVTERTRAEEALRRSERRYRDLYNQTPAMLHSIDPDGRIVAVSDFWLERMGYARDEVLGRKSTDFLSEESRIRAAAVVRDFFVCGRAHQVPYEMVAASGKILNVLISAISEQDEDGRIVRSLAVVEDVTQRLKAESALRESRANLRAVLESTEDLIASRDRSHGLVIYNSAFAAVCRRVLGLEAAPGLVTADALPPEESQKWKEVLDRVLAGEPHEEEFSHSFPEGETRFYDFRLTPIWSGNEIIGTAEFTRDITERKRADEELRRSEERFHSFMVHFPGFAFLKEADGRYIWANRSPAGDESIPPEGLVGRTDGEIFPPIFADHYGKTDREVRETGLRVQTVAAAPGRNRDRYQVISKFPVGPERPVARIGGMAIDITELVDTRERLQAALEEKETLLREVHHRVKNNLAVINSLLALQYRRVTDSPSRDALLESQSRISAMALIHENLYKGDRLGEVEFQRYAEDLGRSLAATMSTGMGVRVSVEARGLVLPLTQAVTCGLILNELVTNSLKYAFSGTKPGHIRISARRKADGWISMRLEDNGTGLPPDFDQGRTLGIRIIRLLVERQLRGVWRAERGKGARFAIEFPAGGTGTP
jgi:PAS domain S-box-containing protein